jgi:hypothetical protein
MGCWKYHTWDPLCLRGTPSQDNTIWERAERPDGLSMETEDLYEALETDRLET